MTTAEFQKKFETGKYVFDKKAFLELKKAYQETTGRFVHFEEHKILKEYVSYLITYLSYKFDR